MVNTWRDRSGKIRHDDFSYLSGERGESRKERTEREANRARINREYEARHMHKEAERHRRGPSYGRSSFLDY